MRRFHPVHQVKCHPTQFKRDVRSQNLPSFEWISRKSLYVHQSKEPVQRARAGCNDGRFLIAYCDGTERKVSEEVDIGCFQGDKPKEDCQLGKYRHEGKRINVIFCVRDDAENLVDEHART